MEKKGKIRGRTNNLLIVIIFLAVLLITVYFVLRKPSGSIRITPQEMNNGYLFDSLEYENILKDYSSKLQISAVNRRFEYSEFVDNSLSLVVNKLGNPYLLKKKDLHYGFESPDWAGGEWIYGVDMYLSSDYHIEESQSCYRCSKILNVPQSTIYKGVWRDSTRYVELYFLVAESDTITFDGFQADRDFQWLE